MQIKMKQGSDVTKMAALPYFDLNVRGKQEKKDGQMMGYSMMEQRLSFLCRDREEKF